MTKNKPRYGLIPAMTRRTSREFIDFDYLDKLSEEELDYLDKFSQEYYQSKFSKKDPIHESTKLKRGIYNMDNARRRDIWNNLIRWYKRPEDISLTHPECEFE